MSLGKRLPCLMSFMLALINFSISSRLLDIFEFLFR